MDPQARRYQQAAVGYLIYGLIYLAGAVYLGRIGMGPGGTVWWYVLGAVMALGFPYLIWRRLKWVTRVLAVLVLVRVVGLARIAVRSDAGPLPLPWGGEIAMSLGATIFALIALATCGLLARAGWPRRPAAPSRAVR
jgi:hypothetical protein